MSFSEWINQDTAAEPARPAGRRARAGADTDTDTDAAWAFAHAARSRAQAERQSNRRRRRRTWRTRAVVARRSARMAGSTGSSGWSQGDSNP